VATAAVDDIEVVSTTVVTAMIFVEDDPWFMEMALDEYSLLSPRRPVAALIPKGGNVLRFLVRWRPCCCW
jgi:hypothetical protein